jgi:Xaa-Pro aminopeptidase
MEETMYRLEKLQKTLKISQIDGIFVTNPVNVFYLSGVECNLYEFVQPLDDPEAFLLISQENSYILTDPRYAESTKNCKNCEFKPLPSPLTPKAIAKEIIADVFKKGSRIAFEEYNITFKELVDMKNNLKGYRTLDGTSLITQQRVQKSPQECELLKKAAAITADGFEYALSKLKPGITEKQLATEIKLFFFKNADGVSFDPIVAFYEGSAIPHYSPTDKKIDGEGILLIDLGCKYKGYCGDMTRTVYVGSAPEKFRNIYETVLRAQELALNAANTKLSGTELDEVARKEIENAGYKDNFTHGLGHGVGLQIHEAPSLKNYEEPLQDGMVFSIEPGIYIPGYGGVRIEDIIYLENGKPVNITPTDKKLREIKING